jgi:hypothetical protein
LTRGRQYPLWSEADLHNLPIILGNGITGALPASLTVALFPLPRTERKNIARARGRFSAHNLPETANFPEGGKAP